MDNNNTNHHHQTLTNTTAGVTVAITPGNTPAGGGDRLKRDEWSEGAVSCLLEAYEAKWALRNRAKLKGHDWEDVAKYVSSRANSSKSPKTQTQCKNKIESMKKRYRSESATADVSSWPLYPRLDLLLRGNGCGGGGGGSPVVTAVGDVPGSSSIPVAISVPLPVSDHAPVTQPSPITTISPVICSLSAPVIMPEPAPVNRGIEWNSIDSNGVDRENKEEIVVTKLPDNQLSEKMELETDCSTPALYSNDHEPPHPKPHNTRLTTRVKRRKKPETRDVAESIRWLANVMLKSEQARADTMRELEKMRADAEVKRGEIDLKRTEIIARTQLEIARLVATSLGRDGDPRMGRS